MFKTFTLITFLVFLSSCATIVNDANVPVSLSFSDGSSGSCKLSNKRMQYQVDIPGTHQIRRSDDALKFDCKTESGKQLSEVFQVKSKMPNLQAALFFLI